jgi:hypothetical protein
MLKILSCKSIITLCFCSVCLRLVYYMLPDSVDCPLLLPIRYSLTFSMHMHSGSNFLFYFQKLYITYILNVIDKKYTLIS